MPKNITILGIGSLLCPASARKTCPGLQHFRVVQLAGYCRAFNKISTTHVLRGDPMPTDKTCATLSALPAAHTTMQVTAFAIAPEEYPALLRREFDYKLEPVPFQEADGTQHYGLLCMGDFTNESECATLCSTDPIRADMWQAYLNATTEPIWRQDLYPAPDYLVHCLNAAAQLGDAVYDNFLDTTYLGNGHTTIRQYLAHS